MQINNPHFVGKIKGFGQVEFYSKPQMIVFVGDAKLSQAIAEVNNLRQILTLKYKMMMASKLLFLKYSFVF